MVLHARSTLINRGPSPKPPVTSGRLSQPLVEGAQEQALDKMIDSLRDTVVETIKSAEWPEDSKDAAGHLINTVESSPDLPNNTNNLPQDIRDLAEKYVQVLEDVHARLKDATSNQGIKSWKIYQTIRYIASKRPSKCTLLFQTCQDDVVQVANLLRERLDSDRAKERYPEAMGPRAEEPLQLKAPGTPRGNSQSNPAGHTIVSPSSTPTPNLQLADPEDEESRSPVRTEALNIARKTFKAAEIASGSIPVAGNFVAAAAKVGLAFVETIQTMDKNKDLAKDLGVQTAKLSKLLESVTGQPNEDERELIANHITKLHKELGEVHDKVTQWKSSGRFDKVFHSRDHAETLKHYDGAIETALEELQLLVSLDTRNMTAELRNIEIQEQKRRLLDRLGDGKYGAQGSTIEDATCLPGTRVKILEGIDGWIRNTSTSDPVLWIRGMAGRGKSTIASTVVQGWKYRASCAIFHFRRGQNAVNTRFVGTLARQLGSSLVPQVNNAILESVRENQDVANERLEEQFRALFVGPLTKLGVQDHPILIVIDALDECDNANDAIQFVRLIDRYSPSFPANVKFLITSRPEALLVRALEPKEWPAEDLDGASDVSDDLKRFIEHAFTQMRDSDSKLPPNWPSSEDVRRLVDMSQGLFQWARTAITYIAEGSPVHRLRELLKRPSMWSQLDDLYHQILAKAFDRVRLDIIRQDLLCRVLGTLIAAPYPVSLEIVARLYQTHEIFEEANHEEIIQFLRDDILADLNSLLSIPASPAEPMHLMHTSIRDLLASKNRCEHRQYYIDPTRHHQQLANLCLEIMLGDLKENICNLLGIFTSASEIQGIAEKEISEGLRYCCLSWSTHLTECMKWTEGGRDSTAANIVANFKTFSKEKLMFWLEVISVMGATMEAISMARSTHGWLVQLSNESELSSLAGLWNDVQRFITAFPEAISSGPLHIYVSSLPHCPIETEIWKLYGKYAKVRTIRGLQGATWPANLWSRTTGGPVMAVAFAPDDNIVVSASSDGKIQLWDPQTGTAVGEPLTGHLVSVNSICFSPDGKLLASGSDDMTIRLWDPQTRTTVGEPLAGHTGSVNSVSFSPSGKILASGSADTMIRLWDPQARTAIGVPLRGHDDSVNCICFSPDGKILASASDDKTVRLWDPHTATVLDKPLPAGRYWVKSICFSPDGKILAFGSGFQIQLWDSQTEEAVGEIRTSAAWYVNSVRFSPDGKVLACGSRDNTVQLWDPQTRTVLGEPLRGHGGYVNSILFSSDGKTLASASDDGTIRLWHPHPGPAVGEPITGHSDEIRSTCFSPDGKVLASGGYDKTIRLWDPHTGATVVEPLTGHDDFITSVCFSPDGNVLASGSDDTTVRLWNPQTGAALGEPLTGHQMFVRVVCFSPDGNVLASGSFDKTIRLWDPHSGVAVGKQLTGHSGSIYSLCFSPDGNVLASGSDDNTVRLWNPRTGAMIGEPLTGHNDRVDVVCFSPDGKVQASGSDDTTIQLWDPQTGTALGPPLKDSPKPHQVKSIRFSTDEMLLMAQYKDGASATWGTVTYRRCEAPVTILPDANPGLQDRWITLYASPFFWLPPQYWGNVRRVITLSGGTLAVLNNKTLSIFDVSQALELVR